MKNNFFSRCSWYRFAFVAVAFAISGCASEVTTFHLEGGATTDSFHNDGDMKFDAFDSSSGTSSGGPTSINDTATSSCAFSFDALSNSNNIEVVSNAATCVDANKCIECTVSAASGNCNIDCIGVIPSNAATAADSFNIYTTFTAAFQTDMPDTTGMLRFDTSSVGFTEFDLTQVPTVNLANCDGAPDMTVTTADPAGINSTAATAATKGFDITALDATPTGGLGDCSLTIKYLGVIDLTGADTPDTTINLVRSDIDLSAKICDEDTGANCTDPIP